MPAVVAAAPAAVAFRNFRRFIADAGFVGLAFIGGTTGGGILDRTQDLEHAQHIRIATAQLQRVLIRRVGQAKNR